MHRSRTLSQAERWELGLLLVMLCTATLCLTLLFKQYAMPRLFATTRMDDPITPAAARASVPADESDRTSQYPSAEPESPAPYTVEELPPIDVTPAKKSTGPEIKIYNGKKFQHTRTLRLRVTAYAPDARCCYPYDGTTTASGLSVKTNGGKLVAADTRLIPLHSLVSVPGYASGSPVPVLDRGGAIKGHRLDVLLPSFATAKKWGSRYVDVKIYEPIK